MPGKRKSSRKTEIQHTRIYIKVESYQASIDALVNHDVYAPQSAWNLDEHDPLYVFNSRLEITGVSTYPESRANEPYELTIYSEESPSSRFNLTLKDAQVRNEYGSPQYRQYRGSHIPVFKPPSGLGLVDKVRGEQRWSVVIWAIPRFIGELLTLLGQKRQLYVDLHERKEARTRWVQGLGLQTTDPATE